MIATIRLVSFKFVTFTYLIIKIHCTFDKDIAFNVPALFDEGMSLFILVKVEMIHLCMVCILNATLVSFLTTIKDSCLKFQIPDNNVA